MPHHHVQAGWVVATCAVVQAGCVYPLTTHHVAVANSATDLAPAERSVMYLSGTQDRYRLIEPDVPDLDWNVWRANYLPPGAIAVAPGNHSFRGAQFFGYCRFTAPMAAGHAYRPKYFDCRYYPHDVVTDAIAQCWSENPDVSCCAVLTDTAPDDGQTELAVPCDPPAGR